MEELKKDISEEDTEVHNENGDVKTIEEIKNEIEEQKELGLGLTENGLRCLDENGEVMTLPRAKPHVEGTQYKFSVEEVAQVDALMAEGSRRFPNVEVGVLKILVEDYVKHPDKCREQMFQDKRWCEENNITEQ